MTEKDASPNDNKPKNPLVEGMRKSKGAGASPGQGMQQRGHGIREISRPESSRAAEDGYQVGGLRWPD